MANEEKAAEVAEQIRKSAEECLDKFQSNVCGGKLFDDMMSRDLLAEGLVQPEDLIPPENISPEELYPDVSQEDIDYNNAMMEKISGRY